jgi:hypothetical protein
LREVAGGDRSRFLRHPLERPQLASRQPVSRRSDRRKYERAHDPLDQQQPTLRCSHVTERHRDDNRPVIQALGDQAILGLPAHGRRGGQRRLCARRLRADQRDWNLWPRSSLARVEPDLALHPAALVDQRGVAAVR